MTFNQGEACNKRKLSMHVKTWSRTVSLGSCQGVSCATPPPFVAVPEGQASRLLTLGMDLRKRTQNCVLGGRKTFIDLESHLL